MQKIKASNRTIIWIMGCLSTVTPFAIDLYLPAFASLASDFKTNTATISLSVSSYFIGMAIGQILYGPFLDRFGRKRPLYIRARRYFHFSKYRLHASLGCYFAHYIQVFSGVEWQCGLGWRSGHGA